MSASDRSVTLGLFLSAGLAWIVVGIVFTTLSPLGDAGVQLLGAIVLGAAVALTLWPILWALTRGGLDSGIAGRLTLSGRRAGLAGLVVSMLVVLRALDAVSLPVVVFLVVGAALVEVAVSLRR